MSTTCAFTFNYISNMGFPIVIFSKYQNKYIILHASRGHVYVWVSQKLELKIKVLRDLRIHGVSFKENTIQTYLSNTDCLIWYIDVFMKFNVYIVNYIFMQIHIAFFLPNFAQLYRNVFSY